MKLLFVILVPMMFLIAACASKIPQEQVDTFAKCLTESDAIMYGAFWCPHCAKTKKNFGTSFKYIKYIECDPRGDDEQSLLCIEEGIDKYDTWRFPDGSELVSEPSFEALAEKTGCTLPVPEGE